jgi:hypothetical protein
LVPGGERISELHGQAFRIDVEVFYLAQRGEGCLCPGGEAADPD